MVEGRCRHLWRFSELRVHKTVSKMVTIVIDLTQSSKFTTFFARKCLLSGFGKNYNDWELSDFNLPTYSSRQQAEGQG